MSWVPGRWLRVAGGGAVLGVLVWRLGAGAFVDGLREVDARSLAAACGIAVVTTVCCAWRWRVVARGLGVDVPMRAAVTAYYRSQLVNSALPGGILGDVHRGVRHGRDVGDVGRAVRAVAWERSAGQVVQLVIAVVVLAVLPSPVRSAVTVTAVVVTVLLAVLATLVVAAVMAVGGPAGVPLVPGTLANALLRHVPPRGVRVLRTAASDLRQGVLTGWAWPRIVLASTLVVAGHAATFLIAARTAGLTAAPARVLPLALLALVAMGIPVNVAGWGPREGVAAWSFALSGLGGAQGVATGVVYGVMVLVANLPGVVVLAVAWLDAGYGRRTTVTRPHASTSRPRALEGAARG